MDLRFPSGSAGLSSFLTDLGSHAGTAASGVLPATPERLEELLRALWQGWVEFLIVEEGDVFVQVAGEGAGPYQLQYQPPGGGAMLQAAGGVIDGLTMCDVLRKVVAGDPGWHAGVAWEPFPG